MEHKEEFKRYVKSYIKRDGIGDLMDYLEKTDFYTAPASTRFHDSEEGGLVHHSIKVFKTLIDDKDTSKMLKESIAIVGLFHDLCKVGFYEVSTRNTKDEKGKWIQVPYYTVNDQMPYGHGEKSVMIVSEFLKLNIEEMMAIRWHMAGFEPKENYGSLGKAYEKYPLALLLHLADMKATYL